MASNYLGPETPSPFSVITERYQNDLNLPDYPDEDQYRFGDVYENAMFKLIHTHLELGTTDRFCYVGEEKGSFAPLIKRKFCLIYPMTTILPGINSYQSMQPNQPRMITTGESITTGAEQYFQNLASQCSAYQNNEFDRILVKDCIHMLDNPVTFFKQMKPCLHPEGTLLIMQRPGMLNTLPIPTKLQQLDTQDANVTHVLNALQTAGYDAKWDIEMVPIVMPKVKWLSMLQAKHPAYLETASKLDIHCALRELTEGMFKYQGEMVEFTDRLLFITASHAEEERVPIVTRHGSKGYRHQQMPLPSELQYTLQVGPDIRALLERKARKFQKANVGRTNALW